MIFGSTILEVAIGLLFVYLLLSLLCSAIGEYIEARFNYRAKYLRQGIELLLNDTTPTPGKSVNLAQQLYDHGLVRPFYRGTQKLPSYIPSRTFTLAVWNMATTAGAADTAAGAGLTTDLRRVRDTIAAHVPNEELKTAMLTLIDEAQGDVERARKNIEEWYEGMMDRVSGWYKRWTTGLMLALGFVVSAGLNVDTVNIANALARDGALRSAIVAAAERKLAPSSTSTDGTTTTTTPTEQQVAADLASKNLQAAYAEVSGMGLPIGWVRYVPAPQQGAATSPEGVTASIRSAIVSLVPTTNNAQDPRQAPGGFGGWILKLIGILLTGFAISQGAPFWFDVLNKFMVVRSTVKPAEKSQEQPSKDKPAPHDDDRIRGGDSIADRPTK